MAKGAVLAAEYLLDRTLGVLLEMVARHARACGSGRRVDVPGLAPVWDALGVRWAGASAAQAAWLAQVEALVAQRQMLGAHRGALLPAGAQALFSRTLPGRSLARPARAALFAWLESVAADLWCALSDSAGYTVTLADVVAAVPRTRWLPLLAGGPLAWAEWLSPAAAAAPDSPLMRAIAPHILVRTRSARTPACAWAEPADEFFARVLALPASPAPPAPLPSQLVAAREPEAPPARKRARERPRYKVTFL